MFKKLFIILSLFTVFANSWAEEKGLDEQQRSIVLVGANVAIGNISDLDNALTQALASGLTVNQIKELLIHSHAYIGFPRALNGINAFIRLMDKRTAEGVEDTIGAESRSLAMTTSRQELRDLGNKTRNFLVGRDISVRTTGYSGFTPAINDFLVEHLFGDMFYRDAVSYQQRELMTLSMLAALDGTDSQLQGHLGINLSLGLSQSALQSFVDLLANQVNQKSAVRVANIAAQRFDLQVDMSLALNVTQPSEPVQGPTSHFTGRAMVSSRFGSPVSDYRGAMVTFDALAHTNWHYHPAGQMLIITSGEGRVQSKGQSVQTVKAGDVVWTPPFVEHWHGGGFETSMSHIAISEPVDGEAVVWLNAVSEAEYRGDK